MISRRSFLASAAALAVAGPTLVRRAYASGGTVTGGFISTHPWHDPRGPEVHVSLRDVMRSMPQWADPITHIWMSKDERKRLRHLVPPYLTIVVPDITIDHPGY